MRWVVVLVLAVLGLVELVLRILAVPLLILSMSDTDAADVLSPTLWRLAETAAVAR